MSCSTLICTHYAHAPILKRNFELYLGWQVKSNPKLLLIRFCFSDGVHKAKFNVKPGRYLYKFIVDGEYKIDSEKVSLDYFHLDCCFMVSNYYLQLRCCNRGSLLYAIIHKMMVIVVSINNIKANYNCCY